MGRKAQPLTPDQQVLAAARRLLEEVDKLTGYTAHGPYDKDHAEVRYQADVLRMALDCHPAVKAEREDQRTRAEYVRQRQGGAT